MIPEITVIILTKNEEVNIKRCIVSVKDLASRIIVVDSGSDDKTCDIARDMGAEVVYHEFETHGKQFNWALKNLNVDTKWVFRLDADEVVTEELRKEIIEECNLHDNDDVNGFALKYKIYFLGRFLKHGGMYPFMSTRIIKNGTGYVVEDGMRDHMFVESGKLKYLKNDCLHYDFKNLDAWINKHNWYSTLEVNNIFDNNNKNKEVGSTQKSKERASLRDKIYYKLPKYFRAKLYYWYIYIIKLGFLDGEAGRIHAFLQSYWYRYLIDAKITEHQIKSKENGEKHET